MPMTMVGEWRRCSPFARHSRFCAMNMINDGIGLLLGLAPVAALVALVLAGLALRNQGSALQNGRFGLWMFWAIVMLTLPQLLSWFSGFGMNVPISARGYRHIHTAAHRKSTHPQPRY